ncbi:MAG: hypothetical protein RL172_1558 [Bacteroidota bacterium]
MNINRHNYEEFFLLYADNELPASGKKLVEAFVEQNPDLKEELIMLQQSILPADEFVFADKEALLKPETSISTSLQEQLLLLLDGELGKKQQQGLFTQINQNSPLLQEWQLLQQTKLNSNEQIVFTNKQILYKKEQAKVVPVRWWQMAAAAIILGFGIWGTVTLNTQPGTTNTATVASNSQRSQLNSSGTQPATQAPATVVTSNDTNTLVAAPPTNIKQKNTFTSRKQQFIATNNSPVLSAKNIAQLTPAKKDNNPATAPFESFNNTGSNKQDVVNVPITNQPANPVNHAANASEATVAANTYAMQAVYNETENEVMGTDEDDSRNRKTKLGGFFKKIKRVVERKTNTRSSDNSIKIANMSFAMH